MEKIIWRVFLSFMPIVLIYISSYFPHYKNGLTIIGMVIVGFLFYYNYKLGKIKLWQFYTILFFLMAVVYFNVYYNNRITG